MRGCNVPANPPPILLPLLALPLLFRLADFPAVPPPGVPTAPCRNATFRICTGVSWVVIATLLVSVGSRGGVSLTREVDAIGGCRSSEADWSSGKGSSSC